MSTDCPTDIKIISRVSPNTKPELLYSSDLSFNNIEAIEGLDSLVKLQDLSLFNNRISVIENLDTLQNLHSLSIGNNGIAQLDNVSQLYFRLYIF